MKQSFIRYIIVVLTAIFVGFGARAQVNAEQIVRVGQNALYFDDYVLSIQYFNRAIGAKPYLAQPYFFRAIAKLNLEDFQGAEADASEAIERNPFIPEAYEVRGVARQNSGDFRGAVEDYDKASQLLPNNRNLMFNKALALQQLGQRDSAMNCFNEIVELHPGYANAYVARGRLHLEMADTVSALADIDKGLGINPNQANAYLIRASIKMASTEGYEQAEKDISDAIRLEPKEGGLYVNRAFLRYSRDDYFGAMADYDYAIQIDPLNSAAIYNRGLLRMESRDNDRAIADFSRVLELDPEDYRALYNRAVLLTDTRRFGEALKDVNELIRRFPNLPEALYMRSDIYRRQGKMLAAEQDYKKGYAMAKALPSAKEQERRKADGDRESSHQGSGSTSPDSDTPAPPSSEEFARRFTALRTVDNDIDMQQEFVNQGIRGKVQDRDRRIALEPMFALAYYSSSANTLTDARSYIKEVDEINASGQLPFLVMVGNRGTTPSDESLLNRHFLSVEKFNQAIADNPPRAIDYFGRAMEYITLRNYPAAIADLDRATELTPDFAMAYFQRGVARFDMVQSSGAEGGQMKLELRSAIADFDRAAELSPRLAFPQFNKGNALVELGDLTSALAAYRKAIELKPDFGEAYFNIAYVYFQLGNRQEGASNLSKAGELGVVPSYNLLKRMH